MNVSPKRLPGAITIGNKTWLSEREIRWCLNAWFAESRGETVEPFVPADDDHLIGIAQAAELLKLHPRTLCRLLRERRLATEEAA